MLKLMELEMKKFKIGGYIRASLIALVLEAALICFIPFMTKIDADPNGPIIKSYNEILNLINLVSQDTFIVFASVLLSRLVIEEFKAKTITVLFMYPISRKKLIFSKLLLVMIFTFISIILSNIFITVVFYVFNNFMHVVPGTLTFSVLYKHSISLIMKTAAVSCLSLIPLAFGMRKYSVPATIISSLIVVTVYGGQFGNNGFSLNSIIFIPLAFAIAGLVIAYLAIINVDNLDLSK